MVDRGAAVAIVLAVIIPGAGHLYLKRWLRGAAFLGGFILVVIFNIFYLSLSPSASLMTFTLATVYWAWQLIDVIFLVRGSKPTKTEFSEGWG
jgi:hypothetical protein